ncbi:unnamed protein product [Brassica oleracea var. botrytis]
METTKTCVTLFWVVMLAIALSNYNVMAVPVMKPAISGHCIAKCSATYHTYECYHDCREERFRDGDCDPKTQMCCCVGTQIYKPLG